jgi:hypothetical protein
MLALTATAALAADPFLPMQRMLKLCNALGFNDLLAHTVKLHLPTKLSHTASAAPFQSSTWLTICLLLCGDCSGC